MHNAHKYLLNESYARKCKLLFKCDIADGIADSIYTLLAPSCDYLNSQYLTRLLKPFYYPSVYVAYKNANMNNIYINMHAFSMLSSLVICNFYYYTYNLYSYLYNCFHLIYYIAQ